MFFERIKNVLLGREDNSFLKDKSILLIDDGEIERKVYSAALLKAGCRVETADCGQAGLNKAKSGHFDLILLDYLLPDLNGIDVCKELKAGPATRNVPIVFLTGGVKPEGVLNCYDAGADCYLAKPISSGALIKQVRLTLQQEVAV
jgi:CheY-like chemotaxis protein